MPRCSDSRDLSELDPVTFFIVTEMMAAEREGRESAPEDRKNVAAFAFSNSKVA